MTSSAVLTNEDKRGKNGSVFRNAQPNDDNRLIDESLQGNFEAYGELVRKYQNRLYSVVVHIVGCTVEAEDVVQDAFVRALTHLESFRRESSFYTWLYRIAVNTAIRCRQKSSPMISLERWQESRGDETSDSYDSPVDALLRKERARMLHDALSRLSDHHRIIIALREIEGFDYETIASILKISIGTVRSRLHRARSQLRSCCQSFFE